MKDYITFFLEDLDVTCEVRITSGDIFGPGRDLPDDYSLRVIQYQGNEYYSASEWDTAHGGEMPSWNWIESMALEHPEFIVG
jgi:hypothetical protein